MAANILSKQVLKFGAITSILLRLGTIPGEAAAAAGPADSKRDALGANGVVAAAHPLAARAGLDVLQKGGNAADAAIATALSLGVVEPNASGLSGGGFALVYVAKEKRSYVVDFRETAPAKARPDAYPLTPKGKAVGDASATGYKAVAVPGELRGLEMLHKKFGTRPWADLVQPAIQQAEAGLVVSETLSQILAEEFDRLIRNDIAKWRPVITKLGLNLGS